MRLHVVFLDSCSWEESYGDAAAVIAAGLLLSNDVRRDTGMYVVLRCCVEHQCSYSWLFVNGARIRNLRPDAESSAGLVKALVSGRTRGAARLGSGLPAVKGALMEVRVGERLQAFNAMCMEGVLLYNHEGEYRVKSLLTIPPPPRLLHHQVAVANIVLDRICWYGRLL